jgi:hypothetical protein
MSVQKKIVRLITFKSYSEHTEPLFKKLNLLNIYKINDYMTSLFMFQFYNMNNMPEIFNNFFKTNNEIHHHNTRSSKKLHKTYTRTNYMKHTLSNKGVEIWNNLNEDLKSIKFYQSFKKQAKIYYQIQE